MLRTITIKVKYIIKVVFPVYITFRPRYQFPCTPTLTHLIKNLDKPTGYGVRIDNKKMYRMTNNTEPNLIIVLQKSNF